nr:uncharacterized protein LOC117277934 [Nicotiana tomentosiformis]
MIMMTRELLLQRKLKFRSWQRCSKYIQEQRTRIYIIWRCSVTLLLWNDKMIEHFDEEETPI